MNTTLLIRTALDFVSQREIPGNQGFYDEKFESLMEQTGWKQGEAWCSYFVELVLRTAGLEDHAAILSASAVQTWKNCQNSTLFSTSEKPELGNIILWQKYTGGRKTWQGHAGIVVGMDKGLLITIEGNTNSEGDREGDMVALKIRNHALKPDNGLRVLGFVRVIS